METKKPKRMDETERESLRVSATASVRAGPTSGWVEEVIALLRDGDAVRAELESLRTALARECMDVAGDRTWCRLCRTETPQMMGQPRVPHQHKDSCELAPGPQRPAVDADSPLLRACVPVPAEPELTPEQRQKLGRKACRLWHRTDDDWRWSGYSSSDQNDWCNTGASLYREGYRAAMARVQRVLEAGRVEPVPGMTRSGLQYDIGWNKALEAVSEALRLSQPPAQPSAEPAPTWPPAEGSAWDDGTGRHVFSKATGGLAYLWTPSGTLVNVDRADFYDIFRPWKEAERGPAPTTTTTEPQQPATLEERLAALEVETANVRARLEERVGMLEAEGARVMEQAARTEQALREALRWMGTVDDEHVRAARRALDMPEATR